MGMFDEIRCKQPLPDGCEIEWFQTKDLGCDLARFEITEDGRLLQIGAGWLEAELDSPEDYEHHGMLNFYGTDGQKIWHEYNAKFTDGRLVEIASVWQP